MRIPLQFYENAVIDNDARDLARNRHLHIEHPYPVAMTTYFSAKLLLNEPKICIGILNILFIGMYLCYGCKHVKVFEQFSLFFVRETSSVKVPFESLPM